MVKKIGYYQLKQNRRHGLARSKNGNERTIKAKQTIPCAGKSGGAGRPVFIPVSTTPPNPEHKLAKDRTDAKLKETQTTKTLNFPIVPKVVQYHL